MLSEILKICRKYSIKLNTRLSQNFLHASHIMDLEISYANVNEEDIVLDIGAGFGFLTEKLAKIARKVYAVEIDRKITRVLIDRLRDYIVQGKVVVIEGDILQIDLPSDVNKIVSNPPFHIISPLIFRLARKYFVSPQFDLCVMIVQLDYAKKMCASPGEKRSRLSATIQYFVDVEILGHVSRRNFFPQPDVDAAIIRLKPNYSKHIVDFHAYEKTVRILFNMPNKILKKVIRKHFKEDTSVKILELLVSKNVDIRKRVRELTNSEIEIIASIVRNFIH